ncbi:hypothetical protein JOY44_11815 [Phormidium sp. CLA17]|uniref:hypothetical protein n=1 Tax=Leptolyngbya sp. Cla-17 TaxID=2803751 RepID=UPI0014931FAC|nr:hypothetical protein [Leptolyngbya sp. Cla-17]MBM0742298.1 hypothetical protein [Leptolyngbya sp. Cla-17]
MALIITTSRDSATFDFDTLPVDSSKASGRMITINPSDPEWEKNLEQRIGQTSQE